MRPHGFARWLLSAGAALSAAALSSVVHAQSACALHAYVEQKGDALMIRNGDGTDWFEVRLTIGGEYFGPENPRDKTESFHNAVLGLAVGETRMPLSDFTDRAGERWDTNTMDAMNIGIDARLGRGTCRYESRIVHMVY
jgi:hypothetical protein